MDRLESIYHKYRMRILRYIQSKIDSWADAEDILQDVFIQMLKNPNAFYALDNVTAWLYAVAKNRIVDFYRARARRDLVEVPMAGAELPESITANGDFDQELMVLNRERAEIFREAMAALPPEQSDVIQKHVFENCSFEEISSRTGVPVSTLLARKRYGVTALRKYIQGNHVTQPEE